MVVPSAEVTVLMGSTFLAVVLRQTQDIDETERQLGLARTAAFAHFEVRVESLGASFHFNKLTAPVSGGVPKTVGTTGL
jgi:hypothetical protein